MKTSTVLLLTLGIMHLLTMVNIVFLDGALNDLVFFFNTALFFFAFSFYLWKREKDSKETPPTSTKSKK
ncbi:hypothetical protein BN1080_01784 [Planococcus massiliensis]|uniref:Uncharacterized protein n=1 Tax=Planococcus massiliensis TaxID=1499687 RepID=A0A098EKF4_9BACL|nr:hypothetical protein [Planococcus massiliensis]CEG22849.1 hypothetical protein BN1080_01784 [Planococcus massiliensis]